MDDIVKTLNTTHQVLMTACALIIILCLAPRSGARYEAAREELRVLRALDFNAYTGYAARLAHSERNLERSDPNSDILGKEAWDIGFTASSISLAEPDFDLNEIYVIDAPRATTKLSDYLDLFEDRTHIQILTVPPDPVGSGIGRLAEILADSYTGMRKKNPALPESPPLDLVAIEETIVPPHLVTDRGVTRAHDLTAVGDLRFVRPWEVDLKQIERAPAKVGVAWVHVVFEVEGTNLWANAPTALALEPATSNFAGAWLLTTAPELIGYDGARRVFLPQLQWMWDQIESKTLVDAEAFCIQRREAATRQVAFLGLTFEDTIISSTGPLVIIGILLYMMVYARNLEPLASTARDTPGWIAFFNDATSVTVMFVTVVLLPLIATGLTGLIAGPSEALLVLIYFPVVYFLASQCWRSLWRVRIALFDKKQADVKAADEAAALEAE